MNRLCYMLCACLLFAAGALAQTAVLEVIELRYRTAEQIIPLIEPLVARDGSVTGTRNQLIVRTTPANLEEIRRVLAAVDTRPRQLLITVRQDLDSADTRREAQVSGTAGGDSGRVTIYGGSGWEGGSVVLREGDDRVRARVLDTRRSAAEQNTQSVQVLEGNSAFIRTGESRPVPQRQVIRTMVDGRLVERVVESTAYVDASTGFHVRPRIAGNQVTLDISPQREAFDRRIPGGVQTQGIVTTVSGRLGEWMELGGVAQESNERGATVLGRTSRSGTDNRRVWVRVEEMR